MNNRIIKFRVWDNLLNKFHYFDIYSTFGQIPNDLKDKVQQFTGLLDSNGKEIYEGDIIEVTFGVSRPLVGKVIYWKNSFVIESKNGASIFFDSIYSLTTGKVIGNVFENPELLT